LAVRKDKPSRPRQQERFSAYGPGIEIDITIRDEKDSVKALGLLFGGEPSKLRTAAEFAEVFGVGRQLGGTNPFLGAHKVESHRRALLAQSCFDLLQRLGHG